MILAIILFAPAFAATLLYDNLRPGSQTIFRLTTLTMSFALVINLCVYAVILYLGQTKLAWDDIKFTADVFFCIRYMGLSLVLAAAFAFFAAGISFLSGGIQKWLKK